MDIWQHADIPAIPVHCQNSCQLRPRNQPGCMWNMVPAYTRIGHCCIAFLQNKCFMAKHCNKRQTHNANAEGAPTPEVVSSMPDAASHCTGCSVRAAGGGISDMCRKKKHLGLINNGALPLRRSQGVSHTPARRPSGGNKENSSNFHLCVEIFWKTSG